MADESVIAGYAECPACGKWCGVFKVDEHRFVLTSMAPPEVLPVEETEEGLFRCRIRFRKHECPVKACSPGGD